jgi:kynureninase
MHASTWPETRSACCPRRHARSSTRSSTSGPPGPSAFLPSALLKPDETDSLQYLFRASGKRAVVGHFDHPHGRPWKDIDQTVTPQLATLVGALPSEVACTSTLTSNLHNLFVSFFRPEKEGKRRKILVEGKAFPSDQVRSPLAPQLRGLAR